MPEERFRRSDDPFFHQQLTLDALSALSSEAALTIYCGAGVTIDRTGLGWGALLASVFAPESSSHKEAPTSEEIDLVLAVEGPIRLASILTQYGLDQYGEDPSDSQQQLKLHLVPLLQNRLYKSNGWQAGRLARNVCSLALAAAAAGNEVDIITTNYDTHLEAAFKQVVGELTLAKSPLIISATVVADKAIPQLRVFVRDGASEDEHELVGIDRPQTMAVAVGLHYLHGRVPPAGDADGALVISERDYAESRPGTVKTLRRLFDTDRKVLVLGASLTDPPLVDALVLTRPSVAIEDTRRYVVMPRQSLGYEKEPEAINNRVVAHLARRCELLGTRLLVPDFRYQTTQLCVELQQCISTRGGAAAFLDTVNNARYGLRLLEWWNSWLATPVCSEPYKAYNQLSQHFEQISALIHKASPPKYGVSPFRERFRLELWVREDPANYRQLTMWANTGGPLVDRDCRRSARLELPTRNATVRAFTEGRPQHIDVEELVLPTAPRRSSRWNSYLSVPIDVKLSGGRIIPVGVLTLASSATVESSVLPLPKIENMESLIRRLTGFGRDLLAPMSVDPDQASPPEA